MAQDEITATFSVTGNPSESKVSYPLPRDPHSPPGYDPDSDQAEVSDYGLNESKEVGHNGGPACYGIDNTGPAGGGIKRNTQE